MRGPTSPDVYTEKWRCLGDVLPLTLGWGGAERLVLASSLLPPLLPASNNSPVSAPPTGFLDKILFKTRCWSLEHFWQPVVRSLTTWHCDAQRSDSWRLTWPSLLHEVPPWPAVTSADLSLRQHETEAILHTNWLLKERKSFLPFRV